MKNKKKKVCSDTCHNCIYIGEGDYICDELMEIVIDEWVPVYPECQLQQKNNIVSFERGKKHE